jgi:hypothetical protein
MKRIIVGFLMLVVLTPLHATHYMGGEITWTCTPQGNFKFTMKLYRECYMSGGGQAANYGATEIINTSVLGFASITMTRISITDLSPQCGCPGGPTVYCPGMPNGAANMGALQEHVYTSDAYYPNGVPLTGVPPPTGWSFSNASCCRNSSANIPGQPGWWIRAIMYPYNNTPVTTCFDNSPKFEERPSTVICTGYPYAYNHGASDVERDSLAYEWAQPFSASNTPIVAYSPGYTFNSPLPGPQHNPGNVAATIDPHTGMISFTSYTNGAFVTVTKVAAFRNGIKVAEVFREMQVVLLSCGSNDPPAFYISLPAIPGTQSHFADTITAGTTITFPVTFFEPGLCQDSITLQNMHFSASGEMLDAPINPNGCPSPPCAGFNPSPSAGNPLVATFSGQTIFSWQTDVAHLKQLPSGQMLPKTHLFHLSVRDDFCPVPAISNVMISITVKPPLDKPQPEIRCLNVSPNGDVTVTWTPPTAPAGWVSGFSVDHATSPTGPFTTIANIGNPAAAAYYHPGANANVADNYYRVNAHYYQPVAGFLAPSLHARPLRLHVQAVSAASKNILLSWNHTQTQFSAGYTGVYKVYRESSPNQWALISTPTIQHYVDTATYAGQTIRYKVETENNHTDSAMSWITPCISTSNIASVSLNPVEEPGVNPGGVTIFPNPGQGLFQLLTDNISEPLTLYVFSKTGQLVFSKETNPEAGKPETLDLNHLAPGVYLVVYAGSANSGTIRLVVE